MLVFSSRTFLTINSFSHFQIIDRQRAPFYNQFEKCHLIKNETELCSSVKVQLNYSREGMKQRGGRKNRRTCVSSSTSSRVMRANCISFVDKILSIDTCSNSFCRHSLVESFFVDMFRLRMHQYGRTGYLSDWVSSLTGYPVRLGDRSD